MSTQTLHGNNGHRFGLRNSQEECLGQKKAPALKIRGTFGTPHVNTIKSFESSLVNSEENRNRKKLNLFPMASSLRGREPLKTSPEIRDEFFSRVQSQFQEPIQVQIQVLDPDCWLFVVLGALVYVRDGRTYVVVFFGLGQAVGKGKEAALQAAKDAGENMNEGAPRLALVGHKDVVRTYIKENAGVASGAFEEALRNSSAGFEEEIDQQLWRLCNSSEGNKNVWIRGNDKKMVNAFTKKIPYSGKSLSKKMPFTDGIFSANLPVKTIISQRGCRPLRWVQSRNYHPTTAEYDFKDKEENLRTDRVNSDECQEIDQRMEFPVTQDPLRSVSNNSGLRRDGDSQDQIIRRDESSPTSGSVSLSLAKNSTVDSLISHLKKNGGSVLVTEIAEFYKQNKGTRKVIKGTGSLTNFVKKYSQYFEIVKIRKNSTLRLKD